MIVGITGTLGAGKGTVVEYFTSRGFTHVAVSDTFLTNEAARRNLPPDRVTRRNIANEYRAKGPTKLMEAVYEMALPAIKAGKDVVLEPQHTKAEVEFIQSKGGIVLAVDTLMETRYRRIRKRGNAKDNVSFEEFKEEQQFEMKQDNPDMNNLAAAMAAADAHLTNDGTKEELFDRVKSALERAHNARSLRSESA